MLRDVLIFSMLTLAFWSSYVWYGLARFLMLLEYLRRPPASPRHLHLGYFTASYSHKLARLRKSDTSQIKLKASGLYTHLNIRILLVLALSVIMLPVAPGGPNGFAEQTVKLSVSVTPIPKQFFQGEKTTVNVEIRNDGVTIGQVEALVRFPLGFDPLEKRINLGELPSGTMRRFPVESFATFKASAGMQEVEVVISYIVAGSPDRREASAPLEVLKSPLEVLKFEISPILGRRQNETQIVSVRTNVKNSATFELKNIAIEVSERSGTFSPIDARWTVDRLGPGGASGEIKLRLRTPINVKSGEYSIDLYAVYDTPQQAGVRRLLRTGTATITACIIATTAFDSELSPAVVFLRDFRDNRIGTSFAGQEFLSIFNQWYYYFSPSVASTIADNSILKIITRTLLYPLFGALYVGAYSSNPLPEKESQAVAAGLTTAWLIGFFYIAIPLRLVSKGLKRGSKAIRLLILTVAALSVLTGVLAISSTPVWTGVTATLLVLTTIALGGIAGAHSINVISRLIRQRRLPLEPIHYKAPLVPALGRMRERKRNIILLLRSLTGG